MSTWSRFVLQGRNRYSIITIDLLGHGRSDSPTASERYSLENCVADITAVLRKLRVPRPFWLGYSMGARIALFAAVSQPDSCRALVLESASPGLVSPNARARRRGKDAALANLIMEKGMEAFSNYWERQPLFRSQRSLPPSAREWIRRQRLNNSPIGLANTLRAANPGAQPPAHKLLPKLRIPVLCIVGERDRKFRIVAKEMCSKLRYGRVEIIPGAGHAAHIEKPLEFNRAVLAFLAECE